MNRLHRSFAAGSKQWVAKRPFLFTVSCLLFPVFLASCGGPTYPKDRLVESLVRLCQKEYGLQVRARVADSTLGILVEIPGILDELRKNSSSAAPLQLPPVVVEGRYGRQAFDFRILAQGQFVRADGRPKRESGSSRREEPTEPIKKLQQVSTALYRVALSTDAPLEFYRLIVRDPGQEQVDAVFSGHLLDSKRVHLSAISIGELQTRSEVTVRYQAERIATETVSQFFYDFPEIPLAQLLSRYVAPSKRYSELLPKILALAMELKEADVLLKQREDWPVQQVAKDRAVVYVPLEPAGLPGAFLFTVQILEDGRGAFLEIERLDRPGLPPKHPSLGPPEKWSQTFFLEPIILPDFLSEQIAKRVMNEFRPLDSEEGQDNQKPIRPGTSQEVTEALANAAAYVVQSYSFKAFEEITVVDVSEGTRWVISSEELPMFRRRNPPELKPIP